MQKKKPENIADGTEKCCKRGQENITKGTGTYCKKGQENIELEGSGNFLQLYSTPKFKVKPF